MSRGNRIDHPEIGPHMCGHLISDQGAKKIKCGRVTHT